MTPKREALWKALDECVSRYGATMEAAKQDGQIVDGDIEGVAVSSVMRAIDRIADLPDDRALTDGEVDTLQASLIQVQVATLYLLEEMPFPAVAVMVAGFDTGKPQ